MYALLETIKEYNEASAELLEIQKTVKGWLLTPQWDRFKSAEWDIHILGLRNIVGAYSANVWD
jgi:hypothetical protein